MLSVINPHPRDINITFKEENHEYTVVGIEGKPTSVTTLIHKYFPEFDADAVITKMMSSRNWPHSKYYGQKREEIKDGWDKNKDEASRLGTIMHQRIEDYLNSKEVDVPDTKEFLMFIQFWNSLTTQYPTLRPYRTEWLVYDEDVGVAGSIDCVLTDANGNLVIIDWKRSKEIKFSNRYEKGNYPFHLNDNCNYIHYSFQLNFYRHILETKYGKNVIFMMLVVLHPNQSAYMCHVVNRIDISGLWPSLNNPTLTQHN
jgi:ATP-dependent exoDNAse (exonuclease V) beta subunit